MLPSSGPTCDSMAQWFEAGASIVGVAPDVFSAADPGKTPAPDIEAGAARVMAAVRAARERVS